MVDLSANFIKVSTGPMHDLTFKIYTRRINCPRHPQNSMKTLSVYGTAPLTTEASPSESGDTSHMSIKYVSCQLCPLWRHLALLFLCIAFFNIVLLLRDVLKKILQITSNSALVYILLDTGVRFYRGFCFTS